MTSFRDLSDNSLKEESDTSSASSSSTHAALWSCCITDEVSSFTSWMKRSKTQAQIRLHIPPLKEGSHVTDKEGYVVKNDFDMNTFRKNELVYDNLAESLQVELKKINNKERSTSESTEDVDTQKDFRIDQVCADEESSSPKGDIRHELSFPCVGTGEMGEPFLGEGFSFPTTPSCDEGEDGSSRFVWPNQVDMNQITSQIGAIDIKNKLEFDFDIDTGRSSSPALESSCSTSYQDCDFEADNLDKVRGPGNDKYEVLELRIVHQRYKTGLEESEEFPIIANEVVAGQYQIVEVLGKAAFSTAVQAIDINSGSSVCLKIINNDKVHFDQGLDEIRILQSISKTEDFDSSGIVKILDHFYHREHLFIVTELYQANLYDFQQNNQENGSDRYFTLKRIQSIAKQVLSSLSFIHKMGIMHSDIKPENILFESYSKCIVKLIDFGSARYVHEEPSSYLQSRSYRSPEVILEAGYDQKIDIWSLGCVLGELYTGKLLFPNESNATLLAQFIGSLGPLPFQLIKRSISAHSFFTRSGLLYTENDTTGKCDVLMPKNIPLQNRFPEAALFADFLLHLLALDPLWRPTAEEALKHPWLLYEY